MIYQPTEMKGENWTETTDVKHFHIPKEKYAHREISAVIDSKRTDWEE